MAFLRSKSLVIGTILAVLILSHSSSSAQTSTPIKHITDAINNTPRITPNNTTQLSAPELNYAPGRVIVQFFSGVDDPIDVVTGTDLPKDYKKIIGPFNTYVFTFEEITDVQDIVRKFENIVWVAYAEPDYILNIAATPDDPLYNSSGSFGQPYDDLWPLKHTRTDQAWDSTEGEGVIVAVIDTGVDYTHEDLIQNIWINNKEIPGNGIDDDNNGYIDDIRGFNFADYDNDPKDNHGHGTQIAGIIAAAGNNSTGIIGVAPRANILPVKVFSDDGMALTSQLVEALRYASLYADIASYAFQTTGYSRTLEEAFERALGSRMIGFAAAGNDNRTVSGIYPASFDSVIAVAATTETDEKADFSNHGDLIDLTAPGAGNSPFSNNIITTLSETANIASDSSRVLTHYHRFSGTSAACAYAAGAAALIRSQLNTSAYSRTIDHLMFGGKNINIGGMGNGLINPQRSLELFTDNYPISYIYEPENYTSVTDVVDIQGRASGNTFKNYKLEYSPTDTYNWTELVSSNTDVITDSLGKFDTTELDNGAYTLKLTVNSIHNDEIVHKLLLNVQHNPIFTSWGKGSRSYDPEISDGHYSFLAYPTIFETTGHELFRGSYNPINGHSKSTTLIAGASSKAETHAIWQNKIVWKDYRHVIEGNNSTSPEIYLNDGNEIRITNNSNEFIEYIPDIFDNTVVWALKGPTGRAENGIWQYDIDTQTVSQLLSIPLNTFSTRNSDLKLTANHLTWVDNREGNEDIFLLDRNTMQIRKISISPSDESFLDISGNFVIWIENNQKLILYNIDTQEHVVITDKLTAQVRSASISGNYVVYNIPHHDEKIGQEIYLYDISEMKEHRITVNEPGHQQEPRVWGNKIVYRYSNESKFKPKTLMSKVFDTVPPTGTLQINNGEEITATRDVILNFDTNNNSNHPVLKMRFSNDGISWTDPENYNSTPKQWTLTPGSGVKTVYVRFKDEFGVWTDPISDSIELKPPVDLISPIQDSTISTPDVLFQWTAQPDYNQFFIGIGASFESISTSPWGDIFTQSLTTTSTTVQSILLNGNPVYVRLWYKAGNNDWEYSDYVFQTQDQVDEPVITSPQEGGPLETTSVTFNWSPGSNIEKYFIGAGTNTTVLGVAPYANIGSAISTIETSATIDGIPLDGKIIYVRLWWYTNGRWYHHDYSYETKFLQIDPEIISPTPNTDISSNSVTFVWDKGNLPINQYFMGVGTTLESLESAPYGDIAAVSIPKDANSVDINNIPSNTNKVYVKFWWRIYNTWRSEIYTYNRVNLKIFPFFTVPAQNTEITTSDLTLQWDGGNVAANSYFIGVGTSQATVSNSPWGDIAVISTSSNSADISGIPLNGNDIYFRLWWLNAGQWSYKDYTYKTANISQDPAITSPAMDSIISTPSITLQWDPGTVNASEYFIGVGTSQHFISTAPWGNIQTISTTNTSAQIQGLNLLGYDIHVRLWWKSQGEWSFKDYTYQTENLAPMISLPEPNTQLISSDVTFQWNNPDYVDQYFFSVGTSVENVENYPYGDIFHGTPSTNSQSVTDIPLNQYVIARLWFKVDAKWFYHDYHYNLP